MEARRAAVERELAQLALDARHLVGILPRVPQLFLETPALGRELVVQLLAMLLFRATWSPS
jgi:hypothetical protein